VVGAELWPHVVYVLNRGGRFQGYAQAYKDRQLANKYGKMVALGFDMTLITYKSITQTKSRTGGNYWLQAGCPENLLEISETDGNRLGLKDGDKVKVVSATNEEGAWNLGLGRMKPMIGQIRIRQGIRPGVVAFSHGHAHQSNGDKQPHSEGHGIVNRVPGLERLVLPGHIANDQRDGSQVARARHHTDHSPKKTSQGRKSDSRHHPGSYRQKNLAEHLVSAAPISRQVFPGPQRLPFCP
jgi:anaerobic selenocysteine-containing dehydrogenase